MRKAAALEEDHGDPGRPNDPNPVHTGLAVDVPRFERESVALLTAATPAH
jgi:hypothetical protein